MVERAALRFLQIIPNVGCVVPQGNASPTISKISKISKTSKIANMVGDALAQGGSTSYKRYLI
jgi:hypothetical protein